MASLNLLPQLFATTVVNGQAVLNQAATGSATNDSAQANASTPTAIGIQSLAPGDGLISIGAAGSVVGRSSGSQSAIAGSTNGGSDANASISQAIGINQLSGDSIAVGSVGSILGTVELSQLSRATSVAASANADAITAAAYGIDFNPDNSGSISTGGAGSVQGLVQLNTSAVATTVGDDPAVDSATAVQQLSDAAGLDLSSPTAAAGTIPTVAIGGLGEVVGAVAVSGSATATATAQGNSSATAGTFPDPLGAVGTLSGLRTTAASPAVQVAGDASLNGSVLADFSAIATSVLGAAEANVDGSATAVGGPGGQISVGADGVYNARADLTSIARAGTTNGDATARIAPNGQVVIGTALDGAGTVGLGIGGDSRLSSSATARQVGSSTTTNGSATTRFDFQSNVLGITASDIAVGGSTSGVNAAAALIANGDAIAVLGAATVDAPNAYNSIGFDTSTLSVAGSSTGGIRASGESAVQSSAQSTNGNAITRLAGNANTKGLTINTVPAGTGITVGGDIARIDTDAAQIVRLTASTVNGNTAQALLGDGTTAVALRTYGAESQVGGGRISIGGSGVVDITAATLADLSASNVGSSSSNGDATARIQGGTFQTEAAREIGINIANQGLIQSAATSAGRLVANSVNGNALALVEGPDYTTVGIQGGDSITAGADGDIQASAQLHGVGGVNTPYSLQATSTAGNADALFDSTAAGIRTIAVNSFDSGSVIATGTSTGNLRADANAKVSLAAASIDGNAKAGFAESAAGNALVAGITDSAVQAGSTGRNRVDSSAALDLLQSAQSVTGTATATGNSRVLGISHATAINANTIQLAGDIASQARFTNTALARSVQGVATGTALNANVLGVNDYGLTLISSGSLTGAAHGLMRADAQSVSGGARSNAML